MDPQNIDFYIAYGQWITVLFYYTYLLCSAYSFTIYISAFVWMFCIFSLQEPFCHQIDSDDEEDDDDDQFRLETELCVSVLPIATSTNADVFRSRHQHRRRHHIQILQSRDALQRQPEELLREWRGVLHS